MEFRFSRFQLKLKANLSIVTNLKLSAYVVIGYFRVFDPHKT